jgi:hypothetical protein
MIRTIVECNICGEEIESEDYDLIRAMPTEQCEMHFHLKCFQDGLNKLMQSIPNCNMKLDFMNNIIHGKFK